MLLGIAAGILKSVTKTGMKGGMIAYGKGKELVSEATEELKDLTAEARAEISQTQKAKQ